MATDQFFQISLPKYVKVEAESNGILHKFALVYRMFGLTASVFLAVDMQNYNYNYTVDNLEDGRVQINRSGDAIVYKAEPLTKEEFEQLTGSQKYKYGEPIQLS
jgi:hypothetical protein